MCAWLRQYELSVLKPQRRQTLIAKPQQIHGASSCYFLLQLEDNRSNPYKSTLDMIHAPQLPYNEGVLPLFNGIGSPYSRIYLFLSYSLWFHKSVEEKIIDVKYSLHYIKWNTAYFLYLGEHKLNQSSHHCNNSFITRVLQYNKSPNHLLLYTYHRHS